MTRHALTEKVGQPFQADSINNRRGRARTRQAGKPDLRRRRGAVALIAMLALLLVSMMGASLLKLSLAQRKQAEREQWRLQAGWLAESALDRAVAALHSDAAYKGETWDVPAEALGGADAAVIKIEVPANAAEPDRRTISVVADFPREDEQRARVSKQVTISTGSR